MNTKIKLCNCALPSMTGSDECCKPCGNSAETMTTVATGPNGSKERPYIMIVSPMTFSLICSLVPASKRFDYQTDIYGRSSFVYESEVQGWTKIIEQGSSEDCIRY